jgi:hypothetical protein
MALRSDFRLVWNGPAVLKAAEAADVAVRISLAQEIRNEAGKVPPSPYDTGHNAAQIAWVGPDGKLDGRSGAVGGAPRARDANNVHKRGDIMVVTTSGYGGFLEVGTRKMRPRHYIRKAMWRVARRHGWQNKASNVAQQIINNIKAQRQWNADFKARRFSA